LGKKNNKVVVILCPALCLLFLPFLCHPHSLAPKCAATQ
jgi:hypothetical protein